MAHDRLNASDAKSIHQVWAFGRCLYSSVILHEASCLEVQSWVTELPVTGV